jgi:tryptophan synthase alpha chain
MGRLPAMNRIDSIFKDLLAAKRPALMPFVCGGHPSIEATSLLLAALERAGASIVEVGFPFSDPIADGPVIAAAMHEALAAGVTPQQVFDSVRAARRSGVSLGTVAMVSVSIVHRIGERAMIAAATTAGVDGFIVPDLPVEESGEFAAAVRDAGLALSLLVAPTTPPARAERIARACSGFVYLLARVGITGDPRRIADAAIDVAGIRERVEMLRRSSPLPIACGFGISSAEQVRMIVSPAASGGTGADAAIVGSALVRRLGRAAAQGADAIEEAEVFTRALAAGLNP